MQTITNPNEFTALLRNTTKVKYVGQELRADIRITEPDKSRKQYCMDYWYKNGEQWVKFSTIVSPVMVDIIADFKEMELIYEAQ